MKDKIAVLIATWFYSGLIPVVLPGGIRGTYGAIYASLLTFPLFYIAIILADAGIAFVYWIIALLIFIIGLWSVPRAESALGPMIDWKGKTKTHDQNQIVIDEVFGMLISCYPLILFRPESLFWGFMLAFFFFRVFDTIKIPPINIFDDMKSSAGVMLDDFMAGIYAASMVLLILLTIRI